MTVLMFKPRFAPLVVAGKKTQTIRPQRKRPIKVGDTLSLREWTGRPYMTPQRILRAAVCVETARVVVGAFAVYVNGALLSDDERDEFARRDGFANGFEMADWFENEHGLPFAGVLIRWAP